MDRFNNWECIGELWRRRDVWGFDAVVDPWWSSFCLLHPVSSAAPFFCLFVSLVSFPSALITACRCGLRTEGAMSFWDIMFFFCFFNDLFSFIASHSKD